jgi:hypothetical protein
MWDGNVQVKLQNEFSNKIAFNHKGILKEISEHVNREKVPGQKVAPAKS